MAVKYIKLGPQADLFIAEDLGIYLSKFNAAEVNETILVNRLRNFILTGYLVEIKKVQFDNIRLQSPNTRNAPLNVAQLASENYLNPAENIYNIPAVPSSVGERYLVGTEPIGSWINYKDHIAVWNGDTWDFIVPEDGFILPIYAAGVAFKYHGTYPSGYWEIPDNSLISIEQITSEEGSSEYALRLFLAEQKAREEADINIINIINELDQGLIPASRVTVEDVGGYYLNSILELALQEIGLRLNTIPDIDLSAYALLDSPHFIGVPTVPTAAPLDNSSTIASTAYVDSALAEFTPAGLSTTRRVTTFTATAGQTEFIIPTGYTPGLVDVFVNGVKLSGNEFIGTDGIDITITGGVREFDTVEVYNYTLRDLENYADRFTDGYLLKEDWGTFYDRQQAITLTTVGDGGAATFISNVLNIPNYTLAGSAAGGELEGTYPNPTLLNSAVTGKVLTGLNITGSSILAADSILTAFGKIQNQINGVLGGAIFQTTWNATTNTPALASSVGTKGHYYIVGVAGSTNLNGITDWVVGDWAIFDGTVWQKVDNTDAVSSVNGFNGAVNLTTFNVPEVTNLYYTDVRVSANPDVVANTASRHNALTIGTANGLSLATQVLSLATASTSTTGALTSGDWNTFNDHTAALALKADLVAGIVPTNQLPTPDVLQYANLLAFPGTGLTGRLYIAEDTNKTYRWNGTIYVEMSSGASATARTLNTFTATAGQTTFTIPAGYVVGLVDVYVNGTKLNTSEYTASNGTTVIITGGADLNDVVEIYNFNSAFTANNALRQNNIFTATASQTTFNLSYTPGLIDVFYNGAKLIPAEYTAINGTSVILNTACVVNDIVEIIAYNYTVGAFTGISGTGTTDKLTKWGISGNILDSSIADTGSLVTTTASTLNILPAVGSALISLSSTDGTGNHQIIFKQIGVEKWGISRNVADNSLSIVESGFGDRMKFNPGGLLNYTGAITLTGALTGKSAQFTDSVAGSNILELRNTSTATNALTEYYIGNNSQAFRGYLTMASTAYANGGATQYQPDGLLVGTGGVGGLTLGAMNALGSARMYAGGVLRYTINSAGDNSWTGNGGFGGGITVGNSVQAGSFNTVKANLLIPFTTWTTFYTMDSAAAGIYMVTIGLDGQAYADWHAHAIIYSSGAGAAIMNQHNASLVQIQLSGMNIQCYQNGNGPPGATLTYRIFKMQ